MNNEAKKGRNYRRKYIITDSASNSKSKSLKTKSNCSTGRGEAIFCKNKSKSQKKNKYLNIKINITKTYTSKKENNNINKVPLKEKNKIEKNKSKSNSVSKPKKTHIKKNSVNIVNNKKNTVKHNKNINNKNNCTKAIPNPNNCSKDINKNKDLISCNESEKNSEIKQKNKKMCRICYMEETNKKINPLIKPCKCSGSMKYIHYECLLHWLKTKVLITNNSYCDNGFYTIYLLNLIECELCKNPLPNYIKHNNKIYSLIDYDKFDKKKMKQKKESDKKSSKRQFNSEDKKWK